MSWRWWVNGSAGRSIDVMDRGFTYGDGLFETIAVRDGRPRFLGLHLERLATGCDRLGIPSPAADRLSDGLRQAVADVSHGTLKLILSRGVGERGYAPPGDPSPTVAWGVTPTAPGSGGPVRLRYCATRVSRQPATAGLKTLNRLEQVLARAEWQDPAIDEGLMLDDTGAVVGGTMSNLFVVSGGVLRTPALAAAGVHGIMRRVVIDQALALGLPWEEARLTPADVGEAAEVFVTNALIGIRPAVALDLACWAPGPLTGRLCRALAAAGVRECAALC